MAPSVYRKCTIGLALATVMVGGLLLPPQIRTALGSNCTNDTWQCTMWSPCPSTGEQTRNCRLLSDCPDADDPRPTESQRCTPPCSADTWACSGWQPCTQDATQTRTCTLEFDCPTAETPSPLTMQSCTVPSPTPRPRPSPPRPTPTPRPSPGPAPTPLPCQNLTDLKERTRCRLQLPESTQPSAVLQTFPEECRQSGDSAVREQCLDRYCRLQPCALPANASERFACAKRVLQIPDVAAAVAGCDAKPADLRTDCRNTLREQVWSLIKFRFDDLAWRAEKLLERGAPLDTVVQFTAAIEDAKLRFNLATAKNERKKIILDLRTAWQAFAKAVSPTLNF